MPKLFTSMKTKETGEKEKKAKETEAKAKPKSEEKGEAAPKKTAVKKSITMMKPKG